MYAVLVFLILAVSVSAKFADRVDEHFTAFKAKYNRKYATAEEEGKRRAIFANNMIRADELNALNGEPVFGVTKFADWAEEEFKTMRGLKQGTEPAFNGRVRSAPSVGIPSVVNWVTAGMVTPVKNQGQCGSCWAFSTAETFESQWAMNGNALWEFSVQQIASCTPNSNGCGGGWQEYGYNYVASVVSSAGTGLGSAAWGPYVQSMTQQCTGMSCTYPCASLNITEFSGNSAFYTGPYASIGVNADGTAQYTYATTPCTSGVCSSQNTTAVAAAIANFGPAAIVVNAANWGMYTGGVLTQSACGGYNAFNMDHAVQLVGYNAGAASPYWMVRNTWATNWGQNGYIYLQYPQNTCGMANRVTQITITNSQ